MVLAIGLAMCVCYVSCGQNSKTKENTQNENAGSAKQVEIILVDTHNDVLSGTVLKGLDISNRLDTGNTDLVRLQEGGVNLQVFAVFGGPKYVGPYGFDYANEQIDSLYAIASRNSDRFGVARTVDDARTLIAEGKIAGMIALEGGHMLDDKIENLDSLIRRGIVYMTLTWNNSNSIASSSAEEEDPEKADQPKGLTEFGKEVIRRMNEAGAVVDLSHVGERAFYEVIETSTLPVMASHSNARALCDVHRNLKDAQIRAIAETGGVVCVTFYAPFIDNKYKDDGEPGAPRVPIDRLIDHIDHIVELVGVDHVGIGSDFFGLSSLPYPEGLETASDYPRLIDALIQRGYSDDDVRKIAGENVLRVLEANHTAAR